MYKDLYLDCEWFLTQEMFLVGWAFNTKEKGQLYDDSLCADAFQDLLNQVNGYIFFYGPDIGMLEKCFNMDIRNNYKCVNLLPLFKTELPGYSSYRLAHMETMFGIYRKSAKYKASIFQLFHDWKNPQKRKLVMFYNLDDVMNMMRLKHIVFDYLRFPRRRLKEYILKPKR